MEPKELARVWDDHNAAEFVSKDAELALKTMVEDPYVRIVANEAGGRGKEQVRAFYADVLIPHWPRRRADATGEPRPRRGSAR
jgi:carboxymethylenebutenolidase